MLARSVWCISSPPLRALAQTRRLSTRCTAECALHQSRRLGIRRNSTVTSSGPSRLTSEGSSTSQSSSSTSQTDSFQSYEDSFPTPERPSRVYDGPTRPPPAYHGHVPLNWFENAFLAAGSAAMSLARPQRGDMVATLGETTAGPSLSWMRDQMIKTAEGRRILRERPRVNSHTVDMERLAALPPGTFGHAYVWWLERCGVTPDTREPVKYIDDPELAYVMQRYRESHDFYHTLLGLSVSVPSELTLKVFEFANLGLPMTALSALFGHLRLTSDQRSEWLRVFVPWAMRAGSSAKSLIGVYWEERWEMDVQALKEELGVMDTPAGVVWPKPLSEAKRTKREKVLMEQAEAMRMAKKAQMAAEQA